MMHPLPTILLPAATRAPILIDVLRRVRHLGGDLIVLAALTLAWLSLVVWTAADSETWQARACADLNHRPQACSTLNIDKDQSRILPVAVATGESAS